MGYTVFLICPQKKMRNLIPTDFRGIDCTFLSICPAFPLFRSIPDELRGLFYTFPCIGPFENSTSDNQYISDYAHPVRNLS